MSVKVGVIGVGFIGELETRALTEIPEAEVIGVVDSDLRRAQEVANKYGVKRSFDSAEALFPSVDAIVIATPESHHKGPFIKASSAGCHILLEKPIASTLSEGQAILDVARQSDRFTMVSYVLRFDPRYVAARRAVDKLGKLSSLHVCRRGCIDTPRRVKDWTHLVFYALMHDIDLLRWYTGSEVETLYAVSSQNVLGDGYDDCLAAAMRLANGAIATIDGSWVMPSEVAVDPYARAEILGERGFVHVESHDQGIFQCLSGEGYSFPDVNWWPDVNGQIQGDLKRELEYFIRCVQFGKPSSPVAATIEDGYESLKIALAIRDSITSRRPVTL